MDRSKRFTNFFHNFVVMKKSVNFLPENKRNDLKQLVDLVRRNIKDVGMLSCTAVMPGIPMSITTSASSSAYRPTL